MADMTHSERVPRAEPVPTHDLSARAGSPHVEQPHDSAGELVAGMAKDAKHLGEQYLALARIEIAETIRTLTSVLTKVLIGSGLLVVGVLFLGVAIGFAAADWEAIPSWLGFALLALAVLGAGAGSLASIWLRPRARSDRPEAGAVR
jgi:VIT1/CCC1 family predicted Fe2+/Mn2+ transporter